MPLEPPVTKASNSRKRRVDFTPQRPSTLQCAVRSRESDSELTVKCEDGSMIPDGEYGLQPEGSNLIHHVQKIGGDWRLFEY